jgi:hypothetical protein
VQRGSLGHAENNQPEADGEQSEGNVYERDNSLWKYSMKGPNQ